MIFIVSLLNHLPCLLKLEGSPGPSLSCAFYGIFFEVEPDCFDVSNSRISPRWMKSGWSTKRSWNSLKAGGFLFFLATDWAADDGPPVRPATDFFEVAVASGPEDSMRCRYTYSIAFSFTLACELRPVPLLY